MKARRSPQKAKPRSPAFNMNLFLDSNGVARQIVEFQKSEKIYTQGDPARGVKYIRTGSAKLSVINGGGKEAVVAILGPGDFFGEGCLANQAVCMGTATAIVPTSLLLIETAEMKRALHAEHAFSDLFLTHLLARNIRIQEDLIDHLFNSSEKRLARTLLQLAHYGTSSHPQEVLPRVSQETLAAMIGTSRARVNFFMNKFRKLGYVQYAGKIHVNPSLLSVVLQQ